MKPCTYAFNLTTGTCSHVTMPSQEILKGYICLDEPGPLCSSIDNASFTGSVIKNCGGNIITEDFLPVTAYQPGVEFSLSTGMIDARVAVGYVCSFNQTMSQNITWYPRPCLSVGPLLNETEPEDDEEDDDD